MEIEIDELKTSAVVILKPSQSHVSTAHPSHTTEKLVSTVYSQNNTIMEEMKKSSSVLTNNSILQTKGRFNKIGTKLNAALLWGPMLQIS